MKLAVFNIGSMDRVRLLRDSFHTPRKIREVAI